jgi:mannosyl-glycoprotein endo-beta-N-acetylglucosaminidase
MGYATGQVPEPGAIMVTWESIFYGHVAYVEQVNADGSFIISEMNYKGWNTIDTRTLRTNQVPLIGFIY